MCVGKVSGVEIRPPFKGARTSLKRVKLVDGDEAQFNSDVLAVSTHYTKIALFTFSDLLQRFQSSTYYKILFQTTQPAHFITVVSVLTLSFMVFPGENKPVLKSPIWTLLYLGSFSAHFGAQLWMTFISGLSLYFALPRHTFGCVQQILFPKYFLLNSVLSLITLILFIKGNKQHSPEIALQTGSMTVCFLTELVIRLYLTPPLIRLMTVKNQMEKEAGVGSEIGKLVAGDLLKCPHYVKIHKAFRKVHMTIAMGNLVAMSCTMFHLYHLAQKLSGF